MYARKSKENFTFLEVRDPGLGTRNCVLVLVFARKEYPRCVEEKAWNDQDSKRWYEPL